MSHYNNEFEPCAMLIYSAIIFNSIESFKLCYQNDAIFFQWVKLEVVVFTSSVLGIFVLMGLKTIMRKLRISQFKSLICTRFELNRID